MIICPCIKANPEIPDRFTQVGRQVLLPGLAIADLMILREATLTALSLGGRPHCLASL
jgi:hypothetical protein